VLLLALPCLLGVERPEGLGDVTDVRFWSYPAYTRVVVELSREARAELHRLPPDPGARRKERLYVDLDGVWVGRRYADPIPVDDGLLQGVRLGQNTLRRVRVVLDLERYERHRVLHLSDPERVVIDIFGARGSDDAAPRLPIGWRSAETVVIDPGHGGQDPGALGVGGLREKDVTLRLARLLRPRLEEQGFRVVLTRDGDRTLSLEERTAIAEGAGGDLFVSLHANAARRRAARGIETYYLDEGYERHTVTVAARENGIDRRRVDSLQRTLAALRVAEARPHSAQLAEFVQREMVEGARRLHTDTEDLGVKQGPFYVLFLSSMPSVLIETGFLTNPVEARRLRDRDYLGALADEIAEALALYRATSRPTFASRQP
jgi:N-acetylmuramoyl-L-alanine amidase